ncbi:hypothetical protein AB0J86_14110 [Micromonospora sp. NPDC049559]|uniref:hypothetical protein n=1 Tax=Micromonospora sp. NPDC049559 TaxID=3155923 RepID=UPI003411FB8B
MRLLAALLFVTVLVPVSWFRRLTGSSRFGRRFHRSASAWDLGAVPGPRGGHRPA